MAFLWPLFQHSNTILSVVVEKEVYHFHETYHLSKLFLLFFLLYYYIIFQQAKKCCMCILLYYVALRLYCYLNMYKKSPKHIILYSELLYVFYYIFIISRQLNFVNQLYKSDFNIWAVFKSVSFNRANFI